MLTRESVHLFARAIDDGGVGLFPADTVYGLACDPACESARARIHELKGRGQDKPAAVMFFALERALAALPELGDELRAAITRLLPGATTLLLPNPQGLFPLACRSDTATLGLRVPMLTEALEPLAKLSAPLLQTSANRAGEPSPSTIDEIPIEIRGGADAILDAGQLPGTASTVVDLRNIETHGTWEIVREGAMTASAVAGALAG